MNRFFICTNLLLCVSGFNVPNSHIKRRATGLKIARKDVINKFSIGEHSGQSPADLTKHIYDEVSKYGVAQSYNDFQASIQNNQVEGVSLLTQN